MDFGLWHFFESETRRFAIIATQDAAVTLWSERLRGWLLAACLQVGNVVEVVASLAREVGSAS
eukprot:1822661-Alexandrium_andersonii.AAC.1